MKIMFTLLLIGVLPFGLMAQQHSSTEYFKGLTLKLTIEQVRESALNGSSPVVLERATTATRSVQPTNVLRTSNRESAPTRGTRPGVRQLPPLRTFKCTVNLIEPSSFKRSIRLTHKEIPHQEKIKTGVSLDIMKYGFEEKKMENIELLFDGMNSYVFEIRDTLEASNLRVFIINIEFKGQMNEVNSKPDIENFLNARLTLEEKLKLYKYKRFDNPEEVENYEEVVTECQSIVRRHQVYDFVNKMTLKAEDRISYQDDLNVMVTHGERFERQLESLKENLHLKLYERSKTLGTYRKAQLLNKAILQAKSKGIVFVQPYYDQLNDALKEGNIEKAEEFLRGLKEFSPQDLDGVKVTRMAKRLLDLSLKIAGKSLERRELLQRLEFSREIAERYVTQNEATAVEKRITGIHLSYFDGLLSREGFDGVVEAKEYVREYEEYLGELEQRIFWKINQAYENAMNSVVKNQQDQNYGTVFVGLSQLSDDAEEFSFSNAQKRRIRSQVDKLYFESLDKVEHLLNLEKFENALNVLYVAEKCQNKWTSEQFDSGNTARAKVPVMNGLFRQYGEGIESAINQDDYSNAETMLAQLEAWKKASPLTIERADEIISNARKTLIIYKADTNTDKLAKASFGTNFRPTLIEFSSEYKRQVEGQVPPSYTEQLFEQFHIYFKNGYNEIVATYGKGLSCDSLDVMVPIPFGARFPDLTNRVKTEVKSCRISAVSREYTSIVQSEPASFKLLYEQHRKIADLRKKVLDHQDQLPSKLVDSLNKGLVTLDLEICSKVSQKIVLTLQQVKDMIAIERYDEAIRLAKETYPKEISALGCEKVDFQQLLEVNVRVEYTRKYRERLKHVKSTLNQAGDRKELIMDVLSLTRLYEENNLSRFNLVKYDLENVIEEAADGQGIDFKKGIVSAHLSQGLYNKVLERNLIDIMADYNLLGKKSSAKTYATELHSYLPAPERVEGLEFLIRTAKKASGKPADAMYKIFKKEYRSVKKY